MATCGSSTVIGCFALMQHSQRRMRDCSQGEQAQMVFADPPYNVPIGGHVSGLGQIKHAEFPMASGEMSEDEFTAFLTTVLEQIRDHSADGAIAFVCMDWRHLL